MTGASHTVALGLQPTFLRILAYVGTAVLPITILAGAWYILRNKEQPQRLSWVTPLLASLSYFILFPIFVFSSNGSGLVLRAQVLLLIPVSLVAAVALDRGVISFAMLGRRASQVSKWHLRGIAGGAFVIILVVGGVPASYPPYAGKLPAPFNVNANSRSVDAHSVEAAIWVAQKLGSNARLATDDSDGILIFLNCRNSHHNGSSRPF